LNVICVEKRQCAVAVLSLLLLRFVEELYDIFRE